MKILQLVAIASILILETIPSANAAILEVPATAIVLPEDGSGLAKVALQFDLRGMRSGSGLVVQSASLFWEIPTLRNDGGSTINAYRLDGSWGLVGPDALDVLNALEEGPETSWDAYPQDFARSGRKVMKLVVTHLTQDNLDLRRTDLSLLVTSPHIARGSMMDNLPGLRLVIRYGFMGDAAPLFKRQE